MVCEQAGILKLILEILFQSLDRVPAPFLQMFVFIYSDVPALPTVVSRCILLHTTLLP